MELLPSMQKFFQALNAGDNVDGVLTADEMGSRIAKRRLSYDILPVLVKEMNEAGDDRLHPDEILDNVEVDDNGLIAISALCRHMSSTMIEIRPEARDAEEVELDGFDGAAEELDGFDGAAEDTEPANADHMSRVECMKLLMKAKLPFQECNRDLGLLRKMVEEHHLVVLDGVADTSAATVDPDGAVDVPIAKDPDDGDDDLYETDSDKETTMTVAKMGTAEAVPASFEQAATAVEVAVKLEAADADPVVDAGLIEISIDKGPEEKLGITLRDLPGVGVVLSKVTDTCAARRCGNVEQGQKIMFINDVNMEGKTKPDMMRILKAHDYSHPLKLKLAPPASYLSKLATPPPTLPQ